MKSLNSGVNGEELPGRQHCKAFLLQKEKWLWVKTGRLREERKVVRGTGHKGAAASTETARRGDTERRRCCPELRGSL